MSSNELFHQAMQDQLFKLGISADIAKVPDIMRMAVNIQHIQWFINIIETEHPTHELTDRGDKFISELKTVLLKNLDDYDLVSTYDPEAEWMPTLHFENSVTGEIKSYCITFDVLQIYKGSKNDDFEKIERLTFKEYDRTDFSENFEAHFKD